MSKKFTYGDVKFYILEQGCELISEKYFGYNENIIVRCRQCGEPYHVTFNRFKGCSQHICGKCSKREQSAKYSLSIDYISDFVKTNSMCILLSNEYLNVDSKLIFKCECGENFETSFYKFDKRNKRQCNKCGYKKEIKVKKKKQNTRSIDFDHVKQYIEIDSNSGCKLISEEYIDSKNKIKIMCRCGEIFEVKFNLFKNGKTQCNKCSFKNKKLAIMPLRKTHEQYVKEIFKLSNTEYTVVGTYSGGHKKIKIRHNICNNEWDVRADAFLDGCRCPKCKPQSIIENIVSEIFDSKNIIYIRQYKVKECKDKRALPFDFAVFDNNKNLIYLIELDGKQHYEKVYFGGISDQKASKNLIDVQNHDKIKNDYCKNNNISLIRIPYWEFNTIKVALNKNLEIIKI